MHYIKKYITNFDIELFRKLEKCKIKCRCFPITAPPDTYTSMDFTLDESSPAFGELEPYLPEATPVEDHLKLPANFDVKNPFKDPCTSILYEPVYTEEERKSAEWLEMQAISRKVQILNEETFFARSCIYGKNKWGAVQAWHTVQAEPPVVSRPIRWSNSQFFCTCYTQELFCNDRAKMMLEESDLRGFRFDPVLRGGRKEPLADAWQIRALSVTPNWAFVPLQYMEESPCPICGIQRLHLLEGRRKYGIRKGYLDPEVDFYETLPSFGSFPGTSCIVRNIISQRMYRLLCEKRMTRAVKFIPLSVVEDESR